MTAQGELYGWGDNQYEQLGREDSGKYVPLHSHLSLPSPPYPPPLPSLPSTYFLPLLTSTPTRFTLYILSLHPTSPPLPLANTLRNVMNPTKLIYKDIEKIACGCRYVYAITKSGSLVAWGCNIYSSLGTGHREKVEGRHVLFKEGALEVAAGWGHGLALMENGDLWSWGVGNNGQLGLGDFKYSLTPGNLKFSEISKKKVVFIGCGFVHSMIMTEDGKLFLFGSGEEAQLTGNVHEDVHTPQHFIENLKFRIPWNMEALWKYLKWLFLGKICQKSEFSIFPIEVVYHFIQLLTN
jgi:alpha-tubulin suppressor-like RCC1 family protein